MHLKLLDVKVLILISKEWSLASPTGCFVYDHLDTEVTVADSV